MDTNRLAVAKEVIDEYFQQASCGLFNTRNTVGDHMVNIYDDNGIKIDICFGYEYFEIFGLNDREFKELEAYYDSKKVSV